MPNNELDDLLQKAGQAWNTAKNEIDHLKDVGKAFTSKPTDSSTPPRYTTTDKPPIYNTTPPRYTTTDKPPIYNTTREKSDTPAYQPPTIKVAPSKRVPGDSASIVMRVFGFILVVPAVGLMLASAIVYMLSGWATGFVVALLLLLGIPCCLGSIFLLNRGFSLRDRNNRFRRYRSAIGGAAMCEVSRLAAAVTLPLKTVRNDLTRMLRAGLFPGGYLDDQRTCLMLNEETYQQYLALKKNLRLKSEPAAVTETPQESANELVREGQRYIAQIKQANDALPGEDISNKLFRLENVTSEIFRYVEAHPEKQPEVRRLMQYHLPTTLKLVDTYRQLDTQPLQGQNVSSIKQEILLSLDTVNTAFEQLLNGLFDDVALDVSSDISVLKTMLAQEGLTGCDDFVNKNTDIGGTTS